MKVSQLLHVMNRDDYITIHDFDKRIDRMKIYGGPVKGIHKDNPINKMHVLTIEPNDDGTLSCLVMKQRKKEETKERKQKHETQSKTR